MPLQALSAARRLDLVAHGGRVGPSATSWKASAGSLKGSTIIHGKAGERHMPDEIHRRRWRGTH